MDGPAWPSTDEALVQLQERLGAEAAAVLASDPWWPGSDPLIGGCFVAYARGEAGPGRPGDRAFAAAVAWRPSAVPLRRGRPWRDPGRALRGSRRDAGPRRAADVVAQAVVGGRVAAAYRPGLLAGREGPLLAAAVAALTPSPDVILVDATGLDHPRRAGLGLHLGAALDVPTVGVTQAALRAEGERPPLERGAVRPLALDGRVVGYSVCTRTGARPILAHAAWRTAPETAAAVVLLASTEAARAPVPLQEARRVAREARDRGMAADLV